MTFDGSTIEGYSRIQESDMLAKPDPNTFELLPGGDADAAGRPDVLRHLRSFSGEPFDGDPRYVLKRNLERAREKGFTFFVGPEMEFFYFRHRRERSSRSTAPATSTSPPTTSARSCASRPCCGSRRWASRSSTRSTRTARASTRSTCATPTRSTMADNVMTFRLIAKEVAQDHGVYATFMPKPIAGAFGSGMHSHLSLFEGDVNAFHDPGDEYGLSKVAKHFIAGLLVHASEIVAITNQWVNSYKRLIPGYEAPVYKCWARNNRSALVRVPLPKKGKNESTRIEFRAPDPACNPYLAFSVMLAAGLKGIDEGYELPPEATDNIYALTDAERLAEGIGSLPGSLRDALDAMERSELVAEALGEHVFENFLVNKRREWTEYKADVTPFEIERSLGTL